ncbi:hypothetical protein CCR75_001381 [Bremia lactucae]|uniref:Uncharacterized protein n=1 Tax=Bremia lactucae TaxID=4779 RepID=A0A976FD34_BRELC|nr:hypothetical protein CCR75_001381 [Bremia lactucae]
MEQNKKQTKVTRRLAMPSTLTSLATSVANRVLECVPTMENGVKFSGGAVAALLATRFAGSLRSACVLGLLSGLFAHSLYADVLRKNRRQRGGKWKDEQDENKVTESS